jgi:hypothetical protein
MLPFVVKNNWPKRNGKPRSCTRKSLPSMIESANYKKYKVVFVTVTGNNPISIT